MERYLEGEINYKIERVRERKKERENKIEGEEEKEKVECLLKLGGKEARE